MRILEGNNDYLLYLDESGNVVDGLFLEKGTSMITNQESVTGETIEVLTGSEAIDF